MISKKEKALSRFVEKISKEKINLFCEELENNSIELSDDLFSIKKKLKLTSIEQKYFSKLFSEFKNSEDLILLLKYSLEIDSIKKENKKNTSLAWSSPIKFHKKIEQTYPVFQRMINNAKENGSIIFVGYAMTDDENEEIWTVLKDAARKRNVSIKIIFDKASKAKRLGKWTKSPKNIIAETWGDIDHFPKVYTYDGKNSSLHAKFLVVDEEEIFVTSANMTGRAMTRNLEMGMVHRGNIASDAAELVSLLIEKKILKVVKYE
jgi:phosphatidylserine/phosphatidylglycerophosphate/cardiolipin synthase-like enzyme